MLLFHSGGLYSDATPALYSDATPALYSDATLHCIVMLPLYSDATTVLLLHKYAVVEVSLTPGKTGLVFHFCLYDPLQLVPEVVRGSNWWRWRAVGRNRQELSL